MLSGKETRRDTHTNSELFYSEKVESIASFSLNDPSHRSGNMSNGGAPFKPEKQSQKSNTSSGKKSKKHTNEDKKMFFYNKSGSNSKKSNKSKVKSVVEKSKGSGSGESQGKNNESVSSSFKMSGTKNIIGGSINQSQDLGNSESNNVNN